jgi:hypothetical protein
MDQPNILDVMSRDFGHLYDGPSWEPWRAFLAALFGLPMTDEQLATFRELTGRTNAPTAQAKVATLLCGRRAGKSRIAALVAVYLAVWRVWPNLVRGEQGVIMLIACDKTQARVILGYIAALLEALPNLAAMVRTRTNESISLINGISIECRALSFRSIRGVTVLALLADEICLWRSDESATPDREVIRAVRPAMLTAPGSLLLALSSPFGKRGWAWEQFRDHYGVDGAPLVWRASTARMNSSIPAADLEEERRADPAAAVAELDAEFRTDVSALFDADLVRSLVRSSPLEVERRDKRQYHAFLDPSGGRSDRFAAAIASTDPGGRITIDCVRTWPAPFKPASVVGEVATLLKSYGLHNAVGDCYAGSWVSDAFKAAGIEYRASMLNKSQIYLECVPIFAQGRVELPNMPLLISELSQLERHTARGGRDSVDHPLRGHDDAANAACGAMQLADKAHRRPPPPLAAIWALEKQSIMNFGRH